MRITTNATCLERRRPFLLLTIHRKRLKLHIRPSLPQFRHVARNVHNLDLLCLPICGGNKVGAQNVLPGVAHGGSQYGRNTRFGALGGEELGVEVNGAFGWSVGLERDAL